MCKCLKIILTHFLVPVCTCIIGNGKRFKNKKFQNINVFLIKDYLVKVLATAFTIATKIHMGEETA